MQRGKIKLTLITTQKAVCSIKTQKFCLNSNYSFHCSQIQDISNLCQGVGHMLCSCLKNKDGEVQSNTFRMMFTLSRSKKYFVKLVTKIPWMVKSLQSPIIFLTCSTYQWFSEHFLNYVRSVNIGDYVNEKITPA
jgi:hypothetical protein